METRWLILLVIVYASPTQGRLAIETEVLTRLQHLEKQVSMQQHQLELQNTRIGDQASVITEQQEVIASQKATIQELLEAVAIQQTDIAKLQAELVDQQIRIRHLEQEHLMDNAANQDQSLSELDSISAETSFKENESDTFDQSNTHASRRSSAAVNAQKSLQSRLVLEGGPVVAFHAVNTAGETAHVGLNQKIVFDHALLNIGNGYNTQHNIFTAPTSGLYIFSTSVMSWFNDHSEVQAALKKNGATVARVFAHGDSGRHDQGSVTIVTQLTAGDTVWVSLNAPADDSYYGSYFTTFMGCLLWPTG